MMKMTKFALATFAAAGALTIPFAAPVQAQDADRMKSPEITVGVTTGLHDLGLNRELRDATGREADDLAQTVGGFIAVDTRLGSNFFAGLEGNMNVGPGSGINYEYGGSLRLGYRGTDGSKLYVRGGYQWIDLDLGNILGVPDAAVPAGLQGHASDYLVGAGVELPAGKVILRGNFDTVGFDTVRGTLGVGVRF
jgi:outer membrane immunogenic protein